MSNKKESSALAITAFVFSLTIYFSFIGLILAVIDLKKNKGKKRIFSYLALGFGGVFTAIFFTACISGVLGAFDDAATDTPQNRSLPSEQVSSEPSTKIPNAATKKPTAKPTAVPTMAPTKAPTASPTKAPTASPTKAPTAVPTMAPTASPTKASVDEAKKTTYIINTKTGVFHRQGCAWKPKENIGYVTATRDEMMDQGYKPCGHCKP